LRIKKLEESLLDKKKTGKRGGGQKKTEKNIQIRAEVAEQRQKRKDYEKKLRNIRR
jgi:hypothetical protein